MSSFGKAYDPVCTEIWWANFIFFRFPKEIQIWNMVSRFFRFQSQNMCFGAWERFGVSKKSLIYVSFWFCPIKLGWSVIKVDRIYVIFNMALAVFLKKSYKIEICVKGVSGKSGFLFVLNCLLYCLLYCLLAPIHSAWLASFSTSTIFNCF